MKRANLASMIPESPRFLISKDRREEAYATLITYHAEGATTSPFAASMSWKLTKSMFPPLPL